MVRGCRRRHLLAVIPLAGGEGEGFPAKTTVKRRLDRGVALFDWKAFQRKQLKINLYFFSLAHLWFLNEYNKTQVLHACVCVSMRVPVCSVIMFLLAFAFSIMHAACRAKLTL